MKKSIKFLKIIKKKIFLYFFSKYSRIILNVNYKHNDKKMGANQNLSKSIVDFRVSVGARGRY